MQWRGEIKAVAGEEPVGCPYFAFKDPRVSEIHRAYEWFESGQIEQFLGDDPPAVVIEGIMLYHELMARVRYHDWQLRQKEREGRR